MGACRGLEKPSTGRRTRSSSRGSSPSATASSRSRSRCWCLNLNVPDHVHDAELGRALWDQQQDFFAYALSFAVIGRFWLVHHRFFGEVTGFDGRLIGLNLFYLAWIVLIPFSSQVFGEHGGSTAAEVLYAGNLVGVMLAGVLMFADAQRAGLTRTTDRGRPRGAPPRAQDRCRLRRSRSRSRSSTRTSLPTAGSHSSSARWSAGPQEARAARGRPAQMSAFVIAASIGFIAALV